MEEHQAEQVLCVIVNPQATSDRGLTRVEGRTQNARLRSDSGVLQTFSVYLYYPEPSASDDQQGHCMWVIMWIRIKGLIASRKWVVGTMMAIILVASVFL